MKKRNLMIFLLIFVVIMIVALICILKIPNLSDKKAPIAQNVTDVINQGNNILEYNGLVFIVDGDKIYRYDKLTNSVRRVGNTSYGNVYDKIFIVRDKLLFSSDNEIYAYDISNGGINKIFDGQLEYANDDIYIYTIFENSKEYLYVSSYNKSNMRIINDYIYCLAHGNDIFLLREQGDVLLFGSNNTNGSKTLFSVDLINQKCQVLIQSCNTSYGDDVVLADAAISEEGEYYYILTNLESNSLGSFESESNLYHYTKTYGLGELASPNVTSCFARHKTEKDAVLVSYFDEIENSYKWGSITSDLEESTVHNIQGEVTDSFVKEGTEVFCEGVKIGEIKENNWITYVSLVGDTFYIKVNDLKASYWYTYSKDGSLRKII